MKKITKNQALKLLRHILIVVLGNAIASAGAGFFIKPCGLVMGGTTGIGLFVGHLVESQFTVEVVVFIANAILYLLGVICLGKKFAVSTLLGTVLFPSFLTVWAAIVDAYGRPFTENPLLASICGALLVGFGIGTVVREGSSTGGTDIPPLIINKYTGFPVSMALWIIDFCVLIMQAFVVPIETVLYGAVTVLFYTFIIDKVSLIGRKKMEVKIISDRYEEIHDLIVNKLVLGVTVLYGQTGYLRERCHLLMTIVSPRNLVKVRNEILKIDPNAFITISTISEVQGHGFSTDRVFLTQSDIERRKAQMREYAGEDDEEGSGSEG